MNSLPGEVFLRDLLNFIVKIAVNPLFAPLLSALIIGIGKIILNRITKKAKIEINKEAEKIKFEIQRKYLLTEIRTRNLLEVYPKLHDSVHAAAGPYVTYFITIFRKIEELKSSGKEPNRDQLLQVFEDYISVIFSKDGTLSLTGTLNLFRILLAVENMEYLLNLSPCLFLD